MTTPGSAAPGLRAAGLVLLAGLLAHVLGVHDGMVDYDSTWLVADNPLLSTGSLAVLPDILWGMDLGTRTLLGAEYLPVRDLTVLLDFAVFGTWWPGHHAVSLAWYLLGCVLFQRVAARLLGEGPSALMVGVLFAVHPVHVESVAWLASRKDVVSLAFFMGALLVWQRRQEVRGAAGLTALLTVLAVWSKSTAVVLPALMAAHSFLLEPEGRRLRWLAPLSPTAVSVALLIAISTSVGGDLGLFSAARADSVAGIVMIDAQVLLRYLGMLAWPTQLAVRYTEPAVEGWLHLETLAGLSAGVIGLAVAGASWRRAPVLSFGLIWFAVALAPVMQLMPLQNLMADRYLLLPSAGALLALGATPLPSRLQRPVSALALGFAVFLTVLAGRQTMTYRSSVALWSQAVAVDPESPRSWADLVGAQAGAGDTEAARQTLARALELHPGAPQLLQAAGIRALEAGELDRAEELFRGALAGDPRLRRASHNLGLVLLRQGRREEALAQAEGHVQRHVLHAGGWVSLGAMQLDARLLDDAEASFNQALAIDPASSGATCNLGGVAFLQGRMDLAEETWRRCLELDPGQDQARRGLAELERRRTNP